MCIIFCFVVSCRQLSYQTNDYIIQPKNTTSHCFFTSYLTYSYVTAKMCEYSQQSVTKCFGCFCRFSSVVICHLYERYFTSRYSWRIKQETNPVQIRLTIVVKYINMFFIFFYLFYICCLLCVWHRFDQLI